MIRGLLIAAAGLVVAAGAGASPQFVVDWDGARLEVTGARSSDAHEEIIREFAAAAFGDADVEIALAGADGLPPGWSLLTESLLRVAAETTAATVTVDGSEVLLQATAAKTTDWPRALAAIERVLPEGMHLAHAELPAVQPARLDALCRRRFAALSAAGSVRFRHGDTALSPASHPLLDALAELAADCPSARLIVTGHSDASGPDELNLYLSQQRAEAVVNYLVARGLDAGRLAAVGAGASLPLDTSGTPAAGARNRRIELELRFDRDD